MYAVIQKILLHQLSSTKLLNEFEDMKQDKDEDMKQDKDEDQFNSNKWSFSKIGPFYVKEKRNDCRFICGRFGDGSYVEPSSAFKRHKNHQNIMIDHTYQYGSSDDIVVDNGYRLRHGPMHPSLKMPAADDQEEEEEL